jgi:hypothetical protein
MQCSTSERQLEVERAGIRQASLLLSWEDIVARLPAAWEAQAQQRGALTRRRGLRSAAALLQLVLAYVVNDWSLRLVGAWGVLAGIADISDVALLKRLRQSVRWLQELVAHLLQLPVAPVPHPGVRVRLCDATTLSHPGSQGTDWRVHVSLNLGEMRVDDLTLSDSKGGEGFHHFASAPGEILLADRAYGYVNSLVQLLSAGAACVVRVRWSDLARYTHQGQP